MRGQAFEVFRLLIAAVVAGAVLMILMNILGTITGPATNPQDVAVQLVKKYIDTTGEEESSVLTFQRGKVIMASAIARQVGVETKCIVLKSEVDMAKLQGNKIVIKRQFKGRIHVLCEDDDECGVKCTVTVKRP